MTKYLLSWENRNRSIGLRDKNKRNPLDPVKLGHLWIRRASPQKQVAFLSSQSANSLRRSTQGVSKQIDEDRKPMIDRIDIPSSIVLLP